MKLVRDLGKEEEEYRNKVKVREKERFGSSPIFVVGEDYFEIVKELADSLGLSKEDQTQLKKLYQVALTYYERHLSIPITGIEGLLRNLIERGEDDGGEDKNISSSPARKRADKIEAEIVLPTNAEFKKLAPSEQKEKFSNLPLEEKKIPILAPTRCKYGWVKEISSPIPASHQLLAISCQRIKKSAASGGGGRQK